MEVNKLHLMDCSEGLKQLPECSIDLTVTSPPYDKLRRYNGYQFDFETIAKELFRVTKDGGVVVWVVGDETNKGTESGTSFKQALYFKEIGFRLHDTMIYKKENPIPQNHNRYEQEFEFMFIFSKGKPKTFNPIKEPCKTAGKTYNYSKRGGKASLNETNPLVRNRTSVYTTKEEKTKGNIWGYLVGMNKSTKDKIAFQHPAIFPEKLAEDHILSWTNPGDIVLDPLMGSGTTAKMAIVNNRKWIGFENAEEYALITQIRTKMAEESSLFSA